MSEQLTTVREALITYMGHRGISVSNCQDVFVYVDEELRDALDEPVSGYPESYVALATMGVDIAVIKWMDESAPLHWARDLFDTGARPNGGGSFKETSTTITRFFDSVE